MFEKILNKENLTERNETIAIFFKKILNRIRRFPEYFPTCRNTINHCLILLV